MNYLLKLGDWGNKYLNKNGTREVIYEDGYEGVMGEEGGWGKRKWLRKLRGLGKEVGARKITGSLFMYQSMFDNVNGIENLLGDVRDYKGLGGIGCYLFYHSST